MKTLREVRAIKDKREEDFLKLPGVTGVDIGYKYVDGKKTDELAIRVYVEKKLERDELPQSHRLPMTTQGVKTDVIERTFELHPLRMQLKDMEIQADTGTYDPLKGGISVGPCRVVGGYVFVGTLGAIVKDNDTDEPMLLSNFHVMCVDDAWSVGDTMAQPSRVDGGGCPAGIVGELQRAVLAATTGSNGPGVDCAVSSHTARDYVCEIEEIGEVKGKAEASEGMAVRKRGRTTGLTYGTVDSMDLSVRIDYEDGLGEVILRHQIAIVPDTSQSASFGTNGDSGSVVVNDDNKVVGLYFAGATDGSMGVANPIQPVLDALNVSICTPSIKKLETKEFKDHGPKEIKEIKETKELKTEIKDTKEKPERKEIKDTKEKPEYKELKDTKEKPEHKELKERTKEFKEGKERIKDGKEWPKELREEPIGPIPPIRPGSLEERLARLENMLGLQAEFGVQAGGVIDFGSFPLGPVANPLDTGGMSFYAMDHAGGPWPHPRIFGSGGFKGLETGFRMEIKIPGGCKEVALTLVHFSQPASVEAYDASGALVDTAAMSGPQKVAETLIIGGGPITSIVIVAPQDETLLLKIECRGGGEEPEGECIDFSRRHPRPVPNPLTVDWARFYAMDHAGGPWPHPGIESWGGFTGLHCGFALRIQLRRRCPVVAVTLVHFSSPATVVGYNADGSFAGSATMSAAGGTAETLYIVGTAINRLVIKAPNDETLLLKICCLREKPDEKPPKEFIKEKVEKWERKEVKELKFEIKESHEPKLLVEGPFQPIEPASAGSGSFEERLARLEAAVGQGTHFINPEHRPDLSRGALKGEDDCC